MPLNGGRCGVGEDAVCGVDSFEHLAVEVCVVTGTLVEDVSNEVRNEVVFPGHALVAVSLQQSVVVDVDQCRLQGWVCRLCQ